jgi:hypothetical protein
VRRGWPSRLTLPSLLVLFAGCLPFFGNKGEPPRTSLAIQRFATYASELGLPPTPPPLSQVTHVLADAVESLPRAPGAHEHAQKIAAHAHAMQGAPREDEAQARASVDLALEALQQMKKPSGSKKDRVGALEAVHEAVGVYDGYRALARALVLFSGGQPGLAVGSTLRALVARISVENDDIARRSIAEALYAIADQLRALHLNPGDLRQQAERLVSAAPLDYAPRLHDALARAVAALSPHRGPSAFATLAAEAHDAVERVARDRPFELQRSATQDALRLISDALTVAAPPTTSAP